MWNPVVTENNCAFMALAHTEYSGSAGETGTGTVSTRTPNPRLLL